MYVNGEFVDDALVRLEAGRVKERVANTGPVADPLALEMEARELARELVIERTLLRQAANRHPELVSEQDVEAELQSYYHQNPKQADCLLPRDRESLRTHLETELRIQRYLDLMTAKLPIPPRKQLLEIYQKTKSSWRLPAAVHAAHIVKNVDELHPEVQALSAIHRIQEMLEQGQPFEALADEHSDCPGRGGDLGFFARGAMVEEFEKQVFALPVGSLSPIFRTEFGFHIARVLERREERVATFEEVREQLREAVSVDQKKTMLREVISEMRQRAEIRKSK